MYIYLYTHITVIYYKLYIYRLLRLPYIFIIVYQLLSGKR
nr:MAG TPA: hypothetical protein [Caudoviricetes sp.]